VPGQQIADGLFVGMRIFPQESIERHQNAGGAKAALERVIALECRLQNPETVCRWRKAFNRSHVAAIYLHREREAGSRRITVNIDGARAADPVLASDMGAGHADLMAQKIRQQHAGLGFAGTWLAVEIEANGVPPVCLPSAH
jgi:hypothetical protein